MAEGRLPRRTAQMMVAILYAIFERARRVFGLQGNPTADVGRLRVRYDASGYDFDSHERVWALVRAAASQQDGAMYLTAAFTGMRLGELLALRVRHVERWVARRHRALPESVGLSEPSPLEAAPSSRRLENPPAPPRAQLRPRWWPRPKRQRTSPTSELSSVGSAARGWDSNQAA
jgi:integrase